MLDYDYTRHGHGPDQPPTTVLIIDGEIAIRMLLARLVRGAGHQALTAADGADGVQLLERYPADIGCAILDLHLPRLSGAETFGRLRAINPRLPVLVLSGYGHDAELRELCAHADVFLLEKPFVLGRLREALRWALAG